MLSIVRSLVYITVNRLDMEIDRRYNFILRNDRPDKDHYFSDCKPTDYPRIQIF